MESLIPLSRILITGIVGDETPLCVLTEIADAHGILYKMEDIRNQSQIRTIVNMIQTEMVPSVPLNRSYSAQTERNIARFVNKDSGGWQRESLLDAFNFMMRFMDNTPYKSSNLLQEAGGLTTIGMATNARPQAINACMLYRLCKDYGIKTSHHTSITQMAYGVRLLQGATGELRNLVTRSMECVEKIDLINMLLVSGFDNDPPAKKRPIVIKETLEVKRPSDVLEYPKLLHARGRFTSLEEIRRLVLPTDNNEAVALGVLNYNINLTQASSPLEEYLCLRAAEGKYEPLDGWTHRIQRMNPEYFKFDRGYHPQFPPEYYSPAQLEMWTVREGYTPEERALTPALELLQLAYFSDTFYEGWQPEVKNEKTPIEMEALETYPPGELVCYGCRVDLKGMIAFSWEELTETFNQNQNFTNPMYEGGTVIGGRLNVVNTCFTLLSIRKLKIICGGNVTPKKNALLRAIDSVETFTSETSEKARALILHHRRAETKERESLENTLTSLHHLGMYMRGWMGPPKSLPIAEAPNPDQEVIDLKVNQAIHVFESYCGRLGEVGELIMNLPLVKYRDGAFQASTRVDDGYTIRDRINIVKQGDRGHNIQSCIRLSSNWLVSSAYRYMSLVGMRMSYEIGRLRDIS